MFSPQPNQTHPLSLGLAQVLPQRLQGPPRPPCPAWGALRCQAPAAGAGRCQLRPREPPPGGTGTLREGGVVTLCHG